MTEPTRPPEQTPVLAPGHTFASVTEKIAAIVFSRKSMLGWFVASAITLGLVLLLLFAITYLVLTGVGIWGLNVPVGWGLAIVNFVWWIGIGHAGTLISAILLLLRQRWRTSINRFAETMTLFAVMCAGIFPLIHMGRPWLAYWMVPYPNTMDLWPQFRSPLLWDVFAVGTYALVSCMFWYVGLIPDLATLRDRSPSRTGRVVYGVLAMGWRGAAGHWQRYETAYLLLAALAAPLVVSVHTVVSFDFAAGVLPGWHSTIFPPYFVAGALFSGFAMVLTLAIPLRAIYKLQDFITMKHLDNIAKIILATGMFVSFGYLMEGFTAWYSGEPYEQFVFINRFTGPYAGAYWALLFCNVLAPQLLWSKRIRGNVLMLFVIAIIVNVGMWLERFIIVVVSLQRDFLTSSWDMYTPTFWDWATYIGSLGLFLFLLLMFIRVMPMISIYEMRGITPTADMEEGSDGGADD